jgi:very-short-patch-repair endonuclease
MTREDIRKTKRVRKKPKFKKRTPKRTQPKHNDIDWEIYPPEKVPQIKRMRTILLNNATKPEKRLYKALNKEMVQHIKQYPIMAKNGFFYADILVLGTNILIELDGGCHNIPTVSAKDKRRDKELTDLGYVVLRFPNETPIEDILQKIRRG